MGTTPIRAADESGHQSVLTFHRKDKIALGIICDQLF